MKTFSLLTIGLLWTAVAAQNPIGRHRQRKHPDVECMRLLHLEHLIQMSNNATLMARLQRNYPKKADKIKSKASKAQARITEIQAKPADWLANCHAEGAHQQLKHQCMEKEFLPEVKTEWNDASKAAKIKERHGWTDAQFTEEKRVFEAKFAAIEGNKTLDELCVKLPKDKGSKGEKGDGKDGKPDGKDAKGAKGPDGKAASTQKKSAASGLDGTEAVRGGAFALAVTLLMAITIL